MSDLLPSSAIFLRSLADGSGPNAVAEAIVTSFHDSLGTRAAAILPARPPVMVVYGVSGYTEAQVVDIDALPIDDDYPATAAYHEAEIVIDRLADLAERYSAVAPTSSRGRSLIARYPEGYSVAAPIVGSGRTLGAFTLAGAQAREWTTLDLATLSLIGHALGLWLTHPDSGFADDTVPASADITPRQVQIIDRLARGMSTTAIAGELECSESTVKGDLVRAMRALDVHRRSALVDRARAMGLLPESQS